MGIARGRYFWACRLFSSFGVNCRVVKASHVSRLHQTLDGILLVDILYTDGVQSLAVEIEEFFVKDRVEAFVSHKALGGFLVGLFQFGIRLAPT